ncbi:filament-like plant protein [Tasmannia lanceolata]|uniref:filament-like plant protein n=1 Tax=Tasmannia lanceolata TaxID=3420 RepID=UPI0040632866
MDRRSWLWRRKSSEKSTGETESSGSLSSHSERFSDDQDTSRASPNHTQSPEVSSNLSGGEVHGSAKSLTEKLSAVDEVNDNVKSLTEKLSAALLNISAKEDLVKQHAKVAEEAVSGWEKAETEVGTLKQQLEAATQKSTALEDRVGHLDGALKECVRQLRQGREEQEQKIHDAIIKKTHEWDSIKFELEGQLAELQSQLQAAKAEAAATIDHDLRPKLEAAEKENSALKLELFAQAEELKIRTLERELSTQSAETASKQHLESIKKMAKLEAECRRLRAAARKSLLANEHRLIAPSLVYVESLTDSQSDSGERLLAVEADMRKMGSVELSECDPSCSDSWASALIAELDQFKNEKPIGKILMAGSSDIDLMDDFLEMERLVALPKAENVSRGSEFEAVTDRTDSGKIPSKAEFEAMLERTAELEEKLQRIEDVKAGLEVALAESQDQLEISRNKLIEAEEKLGKLMALASESKKAVEVELEVANTKRKVAESQLEAADADVRTLRAKVDSLEVEIEKERSLSAETAVKCQNLEDKLLRKKREAELRRAASSNGELKIKQDKELAVAAGKLAECQKTIASLGLQLKSLATLEDFLLDPEMPDLNGESPVLRGRELRKSYSSDAYLPKKDNSSKIIDESGPSPNSIDGESPPSSSSSSSSSNHALGKSRNGLAKLFSRGKNGGISHIENQ